MVNPEICTGHLNFRDRDSHFIFGDACTAVIVERADLAVSKHQFDIVSTRLLTQFSNNIRNNFGFLQPRRRERYRQSATSCSSRKAARCSRMSARWSPS